MSWIIFAYKPNSEDWCRGYRMESYPSDFKLHETDSTDEAIEFISDILFENKNLGSGEDGYTVYIARGDILVCPDFGFGGRGEETDGVLEKAMVIAEEKQEAHLAAEERSKRAAAASQAAAEKRRELATLKRLKEKYEGDEK